MDDPLFEGAVPKKRRKKIAKFCDQTQWKMRRAQNHENEKINKMFQISFFKSNNTGKTSYCLPFLFNKKCKLHAVLRNMKMLLLYTRPNSSIFGVVFEELSFCWPENRSEQKTTNSSMHKMAGLVSKRNFFSGNRKQREKPEAVFLVVLETS